MQRQGSEPYQRVPAGQGLMEIAPHKKSTPGAKGKLDHQKGAGVAVVQVVERGELGQDATEQYRQRPG
jgi:hypothetical protein